ncbi:MAG: ABC transporter permease [Clostridia bacterium]|nr:ABC transporter permease [Clostridia bacterium]
MKRQKMYFRMVVASLIRRRSRMLVALLAIAIGATILSGLVTIYYDVPRQMGAQFRGYGANMILLPQEENSMDMAAMEAALTHIPAESVSGAAPYRYETIRVNEQPIIIAGTDLQGAVAASPYWMITGELPSASGQALIGKEVASLLGLSVGASFTASYTPAQAETSENGVTQYQTMPFEVTGVLDTGGSEEQYIFLSSQDVEALTGEEGTLDVVQLSVNGSQQELEAYADAINGAVPQLAARLVKRVTQSETTVLTKLQSLVFLVTAVVLVLTMVCVATTMMAVVTERRKEIGLRKALGASNQSIIMEFMGEGLVLGALGGLLGSVLGFGFAQLVSTRVFNSSIRFQGLLVPITILVSVAVTALACLLPVRSATDIEPALVLKGE